MRSQTRTAPSQPLPNRTVFSSIYGSARVYTRRHINGCQLPTPDHNHCSCPKWIYAKARGGKHSQQAAGTPSFTEACGLAQKILKGFDPEIRAAREQASASASPAGISFEAALTRYYSALRARKLADGYLGGIIFPVFDRRKPRPHNRGRRVLNVSLLDFLDSHNCGYRSDPITRVDQISGELLDDWAAAWESNDMTSKQWRTVATSFFRWSVTRGHLQKLPTFGERQRIKPGNRCGYFTDEQFARILATLPFYRAERGFMPANYAKRLGAFIDLGRWAGMAVADIVRFAPRINLAANNVLTYRRIKTGQMAVVLLDPAVADRLRAIPGEADAGQPAGGTEPENGQPFRFRGITEDRSRGIWRERFQKLCEKAGILEIETEIGTRRRPHPHMLRDTFAIDAITRGVSLENVAKMLGHATVEMTQRAYLFWIQKRLDYCIEDQRAALARVQPLSGGAATAETGKVSGRRALVH